MADFVQRYIIVIYIQRQIMVTCGRKTAQYKVSQVVDTDSVRSKMELSLAVKHRRDFV